VARDRTASAWLASSSWFSSVASFTSSTRSISAADASSARLTACSSVAAVAVIRISGDSGTLLPDTSPDARTSSGVVPPPASSAIFSM
jgi:hypothetical protein